MCVCGLKCLCGVCTEHCVCVCVCVCVHLTACVCVVLIVHTVKPRTSTNLLKY